MNLGKKKISIIGSTGSVGRAAYAVVIRNKDLFIVEALVAKSNFKLLAEQALSLGVSFVFIEQEDKYLDLKNLLLGSNIKVFAGKKAILNFISKESASQTILICSSGYESLYYFYEALKTDKNIAIANKESIICVGELLQKMINTSRACLIPVDSEHSSLFQILAQEDLQNVSTVLITASGGPFVDYSLNQMETITKEQALKHPTWSMGAKITVDSATFVNKGLEVIEAAYLFGLKADQIEVLIHRQSVLHGGVNFKDGSFIGHFSYPSMEIPVAYSLFYPNRITTNVKPFSFADVKNLSFEKIDETKFKAVKIAKNILLKGNNYPCIFNISNEIAVNYFLNDRISFNKIIDVIEYAIDNVESVRLVDIDQIFEEIQKIRYVTEKYIKKLLV